MAEGLIETVAADAALELMPLAFESLAPEAFAGFGGETLSSLFGSEIAPSVIQQAVTPAAQGVLEGGMGAGEGITAATKGAVETGAAMPDISAFAQNAPQGFSPEELNAISQGQADALASGPSPYESLASNTETQLVPKAPMTSPEMAPVNTPMEGVQPTVPTTPNPAVTPKPTDTGFMEGFSNFVDKHPFMTGAGIYGVASATGMLNQKPQTFGNQNQTSFNNPYHFSDKFQGSHPNPQQYQANYSGYPGYPGYSGDPYS